MNPIAKRLLFCLLLSLMATTHLSATIEPDEAVPGLPVHDVFGYLVFDAGQADGITPTSYCEQQYCYDDGDCRWLCDCEQAKCRRWVCSDPCDGGGGGSGGGGPSCSAFCTDNADCTLACPSGTSWTCSGNTCVP